MSSTNPVALGTPTPGVATVAAREDHVHPTTGLSLSTHNHAGTYLPMSGGTLTGLLTLSGAPTVDLHAATKIYADTTASTAASSRVAKTGDTMTGNLTISKSYPVITLQTTTAGMTPDVMLDAPAATNRNITFKTGGLHRWQINASNGAETGSNAGTNLNIYRYNDAGAYVDAPVQISRATGLVTVLGNPTSTLGVATKAYADTKMPIAGGTFTGRVQIDTSQGITLHNNNGNGGANSVNSVGSIYEGGRYCIEVTDGWNADSGVRAPVQVGTPINGSSAVTVDWVRGDRAAATHSHTRHQAGYNILTVDLGTLNAGVAYGPWTVAHGLGTTPGVVICCPYGDDGVHSIVGSIGGWDAANVTFTARNVGGANEACGMTIVAFV